MDIGACMEGAAWLSLVGSEDPRSSACSGGMRGHVDESR
jgi:hypothetical protein